MANVFTDTLQYLYDSFQGIFSNFIVAVIILLLGLILGRIAGKVIQRVLKEVEFDTLLKRTTGIKASVSELLGKAVSYFIYFIFVIAALERLNISSVAFNLLAGGVILVIILSIFLAIKDFVPNMIAGIYISQKRLISEGDHIKFNGMEGVVIELQLTMTKLESKNKDMLFIPNSTLLKSKIVKSAKKSK